MVEELDAEGAVLGADSLMGSYFAVLADRNGIGFVAAMTVEATTSRRGERYAL